MRRMVAVIVATSMVLAASLASAQDKDDKRVDHATDKALEFLARMQRPDGSWPGNTFNKNSAISGLAVMAFMAKGHTPGEGRYGDHINRGIDYVLSTADPKTGYIVAQHSASHGGMYSHGICTLMLAEAVGMTDGEREKKIREALEKAVLLILEAQKIKRPDPRQQGGWRYNNRSNDSDISVTGWQLLSLRAAKNAGADVPADAIEDAVRYVKVSASKGGGFGYQPGGGSSRARAGTGILCLEICGQHHSAEATAAAEYLIQHPPAWPDEWFYYGIYYGSQGMFQMGDHYWEFYQPRLEALLLSLQEDDGSWPNDQGGEARAGNIYSTSMAVLALSVKYHYLPIYQR